MGAIPRHTRFWDLIQLKFTVYSFAVIIVDDR